MTWYEFWLFLHLAAAMVWIGGGTAGAGPRHPDEAGSRPGEDGVLRASVSGPWTPVFLPASLVVVGAGIGLVENGDWDWGEPFIACGLLLWAARRARRVRLPGPGDGRGGRAPRPRGRARRSGLTLRNLVWLSRALLAVLVVIVFLMTVKPGT